MDKKIKEAIKLICDAQNIVLELKEQAIRIDDDDRADYLESIWNDMENANDKLYEIA